MPGHVVVKAFPDNNEIMLDADFGVYINASLVNIEKEPDLISETYLKSNFSVQDVKALTKSLLSPKEYWKDTKAFMTNKYYFEKSSYILKWLFPILLILINVLIRYKTKVKGKRLGKYI
jgi:hypothetical protein